jgi:hypothetical protein
MHKGDAMRDDAYVTVVDIDIAARTLAVAIAHDDAPPTLAVMLANDAAGWQELMVALTTRGSLPATTLVVMEATEAYGQGLATTLHTAGWGVSVVPPGGARSSPFPLPPRQDGCPRCRLAGRLCPSPAARPLDAAGNRRGTSILIGQPIATEQSILAVHKRFHYHGRMIWRQQDR